MAAHLEPVPMRLGDTLYEPGGQLQHAYFPTTAIVSLLYVLESGASAEIAGVGNEGILGISLFMGGNTTPSSAVVQTAGQGYRLPRKLLQEEFNRAGLMQRLLLRYTQALLTQMCQTAACNRHHSIQQQLCRWLLLSLDRSPSNELCMTQDLVAGALGVRREGIRRPPATAGDAPALPPADTLRCSSAPVWRPALRMLAVVRKEFAACWTTWVARALPRSPSSALPRAAPGAVLASVQTPRRRGRTLGLHSPAAVDSARSARWISCRVSREQRSWQRKPKGNRHADALPTTGTRADVDRRNRHRVVRGHGHRCARPHDFGLVRRHSGRRHTSRA